MQVYPADNILICTSLGSYLPDKALGVCMGGAGAGGNIGALLGGGRGAGAGAGAGAGLDLFQESKHVLSSKQATSFSRVRGVEKNKHQNSRVWYVPKGTEDTGTISPWYVPKGTEDTGTTVPIFLFLSWKECLRGDTGPIFFLSYSSSLSDSVSL